MSALYGWFERHGHGAGAKGESTHYCPGCGHGLVQQMLAEAIDALGVGDRTVAISPVGCSVFLYYYLDVGNTQAAHGRAPAVALGHKLANPASVVVSYQGDGDLASIGLGEILHAATLGIPLTVVFVNNAIYGMTGGQLAPTTLAGQRTTTSPAGRGRLQGQPLKVAELVAQLDGPVYVERVALFDAKQRVRAARAIEKALRMQVEDRGFSLVEVLSECPTHLKLPPQEAERWVREQMLPVYPLGVKKDVDAPPWGPWSRPSFDAAALSDVLGASATPPPRYCEGFPQTAFGDEIALKLAGAGGDGAQTAAMLLVHAAVREGFDATHIPSYGPESRGGTSYADVRLAAGEVLAPDAPHPHVLVAFNAPSAQRFAHEVVPGGVVLYDSSVVTSPPAADATVRVVGVPCAEIAHALGKPLAKNVVALGALAAATRILPEATLLAEIRDAFAAKPGAAALNAEAFARGVRAVS